MTWDKTSACTARVHCVACRKSVEWRKTLFDAKLVDVIEFNCPHGITVMTALQIQTDALVARAKSPEQLATIARGLRQRPGTGCAPCGSKANNS